MDRENAVIEEIKTKLESIPSAPGVYLMKDVEGEVIYVGKALCLKKRVRSYFQSILSSTGAASSRDARPAARHLATKTADIEFIVTRNENEAFILENNLIKKIKPRYNIRLRDDKTFLSLKVDLQQPFPSIVPIRRVRKDGAQYFGPYSSARAVRATLRLLRTLSPLRSCSEREFRNRSRPCIQYQIRRCSGPCCGLISEEDYRTDLEVALKVLRGEVRELRDELMRRMDEAAQKLEFEAAAILRDQIRGLEHFSMPQKVENSRYDDADVLGYYRESGISEVLVLFFRNGKLVASSPFCFELPLEPEELLSQFVLRYYGESRHVPRMIFLPLAIPDMKGIATFLRNRRKGAVAISVPKKGDAAKLTDMANENARLSQQASRGMKQIAAGIAEALREQLELERAPLRIEGVDISNTGGSEAVGSVVHFKDGEPLKSRYRRFRVKTVGAADDYAMMREVLGRRLRRGRDEDNLPDLLLVDGGVGHVAAAVQAACEAGVTNLEIAGLAKGDSRARAVVTPSSGDEQPGAAKIDRVFRPGRRDPIDLPVDSGEFRLLQRIRDEAHRFAITYHRKVRGKQSLASSLDEVPGLGEAKRQTLLVRFGGLRGLKRASLEEIMAVEGIGPVLARRIADRLTKNESSS